MRRAQKIDGVVGVFAEVPSLVEPLHEEIVVVAVHHDGLAEVARCLSEEARCLGYLCSDADVPFDPFEERLVRQAPLGVVRITRSEVEQVVNELLLGCQSVEDATLAPG